MDKIARNLVDYEAGKTIFEVYTGQYLAKQITNGLYFKQATYHNFFYFTGKKWVLLAKNENAN